MLRFLRQQGARWFLFLAIAELALLYFSAFLGTHVRFASDPHGMEAALAQIHERGAMFALCLSIGLAAMGLYQRYLRETWFGVLVRVALGFVMGATLLVTIYYIAPETYVGRGVFALAIGFALPALLGFRWLFFQLIDEDLLKRRVLVFGAGAHAASIVQQLRRRADRRGFLVLGFVPVPGEPVLVEESLVVRPEGRIADHAWKNKIDEIVVGPDDRRGKLPMADLLAARMAGIEVTELPTFFEREQGKIKLNLIHPSWMVFNGGFHNDGLRQLTKRTFDVLAALLLLVASIPAMAAVALAIWLESGFRGPIIYRQVRVGEFGEPFTLYKFRSMRTDAEQAGRAIWAKADDDRVTRVGRFIRKVRLDELPQLYNVLNGDMSLIGPRPERPQFVESLSKSIPYYQLRHWVKPGLTGWAQLRFPYGASEEDAAEKLKFDLFYVKNQKLTFDLLILIQTVEVVLFGRGAR